jgi:hypothetical protein
VDNALIGVLGVIGGALATGGVQLGLASRARHTDAIAAARMLFAALAEAEACLRSGKKTGSWGASENQFKTPLVAWGEYRVPFARGVTSSVFERVARGFGEVRNLQNVRTANSERNDEGVAVVLRDAQIDVREQVLLTAMELARKAGERWSDRLRKQQPTPTV